MNESYEWVEKAVVFSPELRNWQSSVRDGQVQLGTASFSDQQLALLPVFEYPPGPPQSFITRPPMKESSCNETEEVGEGKTGRDMCY